MIKMKNGNQLNLKKILEQNAEDFMVFCCYLKIQLIHGKEGWA